MNGSEIKITKVAAAAAPEKAARGGFLLAVDAGNTNIKFGLFRGGALFDSWRIGTSLTRTSDEYGAAVADFLHRRGLSAPDITGVVIGSVIPGLNYTLQRLCEYFFKKTPVIAGSAVKTGITLKYDNPSELGADRIANSLAAYKLYGGAGKPLAVIDFGTATAFNAVGEAGEFLGGLIAPGIKTAGDALTDSAARLTPFEYKLPPRAVNRSTVTNIQAGVLYGAIGMIEYICAKIKAECGFKNMRVVATGGLSDTIISGTKVIDAVDKTLTLTGLRMLYELNSPRT